MARKPRILEAPVAAAVQAGKMEGHGRELGEDWQEFHDRELKRHAESWLRERGIDPVWR